VGLWRPHSTPGFVAAEEKSLGTEGRPMTSNGKTNRHPTDELADIRGQIKTLQERESELRAMLLNGDCDLTGDDYVAVIRIMPCPRLDVQALREHLGPRLKAFMVERDMTQICLGARK
jgi:hypothetical protein